MKPNDRVARDLEATGIALGIGRAGVVGNPVEFLENFDKIEQSSS